MQELGHIFQRSYQRGAVLLLAMMFMLLLAMVASSVMQTSFLELQMAGNEQFREEALQRAQAIASALAAEPENFPVVGGVGYTLCASGDTDPGCDVNELLDVPQFVLSVNPGVNLFYRVTRKGPLLLQALPIRQSQGRVSSNNGFAAAVFEIGVTVDGAPARLGSSQIALGIARRVPGSMQ